MTVQDTSPLLLWFRRDLRLADHPMLTAAAATGRPLIPVFVHDETVEALGAAAKWRLGLAVGRFAETLAGMGSRLTLRRGAALEELRRLMADTGAGAVWWTRAYDRASVARDTKAKAALPGARSFSGQLLAEPWEVSTGAGGPYRVFTPFWRALRARDIAAPLPPPKALRARAAWPASDRLADWAMGKALRQGADVLAKHAAVGEVRATAQLHRFLEERAASYSERRDFPADDATSNLSEALSCGEIGPRTIWHAALHFMHDGTPGAEAFLRQLAWRDFAWHLLHHWPDLDRATWREGWDAFPWRGDNPQAEIWRRGMTGEPFVDAAMRQMYVTGRMHNRARMIAASYLTKHLLTDWRVGLHWFQDCLTDWDPAANAMGWQWVAGCGPDAAPYFRIFNPAAQADRFDPDGSYRATYLAEGRRNPATPALDFFAACPKSWCLGPKNPYPDALIALPAGRVRALDAYASVASARRPD